VKQPPFGAATAGGGTFTMPLPQFFKVSADGDVVGGAGTGPLGCPCANAESAHARVRTGSASNNATTRPSKLDLAKSRSRIIHPLWLLLRITWHRIHCTPQCPLVRERGGLYEEAPEPATATGVAHAAAFSPLECSAAAPAQQPGGPRRVGVLTAYEESDPERWPYVRSRIGEALEVFE
jgi:hypothetical protein